MTRHRYDDVERFRRDFGRGVLADARHLSLQASLESLPPELFELGDTLESLDLGGNRLTDLPSAFSRLRGLRILFCSGNRFRLLPPVLGACVALTQIGCRDAAIEEVPGEALPPGLRWLTLTGNRLRALPPRIGEMTRLRKLMLAGNQLVRLPDELQNCTGLELLRLSANRLAGLPPWLAQMPCLAWLAWSGNGFGAPPTAPEVRAYRWDELRLGAVLGQGASGTVHAVEAAPDGRPMALKLFKGALTSDGLPDHEQAACLAAGDHPNLVGAIGRLVAHSDGRGGLLMPLLPAGTAAVADPPDAESCSRDTYPDDRRFAGADVLRLAHDAALAADHLHARGIVHGDLYGHNLLWAGPGSMARLSDLGAASFLFGGPGDGALCRLDVRAWGVLVEELLVRCSDPLPARLRELCEAAQQARVLHRPSMAEIARGVANLF
ncbi:leucine-rich repeat-containing protein kinase family protein [Rhizosaccharibacter radicis]|uniref:Leucine-rich repeat-containing serine/threonine-protein kinase n=1 Tax=Rhizosaccharibacter radicis TaxID=2782605 RepID=A0ABT1VZH3_9PROT|nr:leucine-rich repeat-containing serine/threonine-protein kinase [Acetobacteraceae bacterium KSS12]